MNKQELIELLKNAEAGSDELNVAYYDWKYPDRVVAYDKYMRSAIKWADRSKLKMDYIQLNDVTSSVDAALGEIPEGFVYYVDATCPDEGIAFNLIAGEAEYTGDHKSLPIAILLAVVEAGA